MDVCLAYRGGRDVLFREELLGCWWWGEGSSASQRGPARPSVLCRLQGNRAAQHHPDPSAGLSLFADADREVTGATNLECYMQDPDFGYQDFARHDEDQTQVFRVQVRFLLSWQAAAWAATSPLPSLSPPPPLLVGCGWSWGCQCNLDLVQLLLQSAGARKLDSARGPAPLGLGRGR